MSKRIQYDIEPSEEIYLDNHATTAVDPRVIDAMLPLMCTEFANAGSLTHEPGRRVALKIERCKQRVLELLGASNSDLVFTSGATESINLAIFGFCLHPRQKRRKVLVGNIDHRAVLDCANKLGKQGFTVHRIACESADPEGRIEAVGKYTSGAIEQLLDDDVALVSLVLGNNEIGTFQDMRSVAQICHQRGAMLHLDATQAVGKIPIDADAIGADLISFSAHKFYGPKGVGGLMTCNQDLHLTPVLVGGGQQNNLRSGTLNTSGIVGMTRALEISVSEIPFEEPRVFSLRDRLWKRLSYGIHGLSINGPAWPTDFPQDPRTLDRLCGNLNIRLPKVDGQSLMLKVPGIACSSGSACTSAQEHPSHVLMGIGLSEDQARCSLRFGIGRFNTEAQIDRAADDLVTAYHELLHFVT